MKFGKKWIIVSMACEIHPDGACEHCQELYCPDKLEDIYSEHAELTRAVEEAVNELGRFVEGYEEVLQCK